LTTRSLKLKQRFSAVWGRNNRVGAGEVNMEAQHVWFPGFPKLCMYIELVCQSCVCVCVRARARARARVRACEFVLLARAGMRDLTIIPYCCVASVNIGVAETDRCLKHTFRAARKKRFIKLF
jgi:hypothetical protein